MSKKDVILSDQAKLNDIQIDKVQEILNHLTKAESMIDVISNSIEAKNTDNKLDLASELNSLVAVYDNLDCAANDAEEVLAALQGVECEDEMHD